MNWLADPVRRKAFLGAILLALAVNNVIRHDPVLLTVGAAALGVWALVDAYRISRRR